MTSQPIFNYFMAASPVVQAVIAILVIASILSWTFIFQRGFAISKAYRQAKKFQRRFWDAGSLEKFFKEINEKDGDNAEGMDAIFQAGYQEYLRLKAKPGISDDAVLEGVKRAMKVSYAYEEDDLEQHLPFLATVGSTSPYIGLFGTVWGIMVSFHALGAAQQVTIAMVAPGISEALIATAAGLFAAIPAVIFYNRYINRADRILNRYDAFQDELMNLFQHEVQKKPQAAAADREVEYA